MTSLEKIGVKLSDYYSSISIVILFHILSALFTIISIPMVIPFFHILFYGGTFSEEEQVSGLEQSLRSAVQYMVNSQGVSRAVMWICMSFILIFFLKNLFRYFAMYFMTPIRNAMVRDMRQKVFESYLDLSYLDTKQLRKGHLLSIMMTDVQEIEWMLRHSLETIIKSPIIIIGSIMFMMYLDIRLSLFVFVLLAFTVIVIGGISRALKQESQAAQAALGDLHAIGEESLSSQSVVRAFTAESYMADRFSRANGSYKLLADKVLRRRDLASPLSEFLGVSIVAVLLWYGADKVFDRALSPEAFFAFLFAFFQVIEPSKSFATAYYNIQKGRGASARIEDVIDRAIPFADGGIEKENFEKSIRIKSVSFAYPDASTTSILRDIDLDIQKGQIISISGVSGAGKTTLINLLLRFIEPSGGSIYMDEVPVSDLSIKHLRSMISIVDQHVSLMHDSVSNNITFGLTELNESKLLRSLQDAYAYDFVMAMSEGADTKVGEQGMKLSGGQRQRIALARAFYCDSPILILDEATSSIDRESELLIKKALLQKNQDQQVTIIIIAHSSTLIDIAHRQYTMADGKLFTKK